MSVFIVLLDETNHTRIYRSGAQTVAAPVTPLLKTHRLSRGAAPCLVALHAAVYRVLGCRGDSCGNTFPIWNSGARRSPLRKPAISWNV
jgi:hypothetical protein